MFLKLDFSFEKRNLKLKKKIFFFVGVFKMKWVIFSDRIYNEFEVLIG